MTDEERVESIIQIASSFGISCDDASYIVKSFENFGKEYMMSNIEDDVKVLEKFMNNEMQRDKLERDNRCGGWKIGDIYKLLELNPAINNLLSEREQNIKRIKELEEENRIFKNKNVLVNRYFKLKDNSIPKQKVKNTLDDIYDYFERLNGPDEDIEYIESKRKELLEEGE